MEVNETDDVAIVGDVVVFGVGDAVVVVGGDVVAIVGGDDDVSGVGGDVAGVGGGDAGGGNVDVVVGCKIDGGFSPEMELNERDKVNGGTTSFTLNESSQERLISLVDH